MTAPPRMPDTLEPQLATPVDKPPDGDGWIHEIKLDGYRMLCRASDGELRFFTRSGRDWTRRMGPLNETRIPARRAWLDGEVVTLRPDGTTDFQALQNDLGEGRFDRLTYFVFDLLWLDEEDLRGEGQLRRKERLEGLLSALPDGARFRYCEHIRGHGPRFFQNACRMALEGTISKRVDARYTAGRGRAWMKNRCMARDELLIGGYTLPSGARTGFGAILLGAPKDGHLRYAGKVGTGFSERTLISLHSLLRSMERRESPFEKEITVPGSKIRFVDPRLVATISYAGWTQDGRLRHATFEGLREDVEAATVSLTPSPVPRRRPRGRSRPGGGDLGTFRLSNPDRLVFPDEGITKRELAAYYLRVADHLLPHVSHRLLTLVRCPKGQKAQCFHQKHVQEGMPEEIRSLRLPDREGGPRAYITGVRGLMGLIQMGVIEIHPGGSRTDRIDRPDRLVFDLDPGAEVGWEQVVESALAVRRILSECGLRGFPRTTGGKGLHVVVPIQRRSDWTEARAYCRQVARVMEAMDPSRFVSSQSKARRVGKVYVDWLRNSRGATAVASYVVRARPGAPVATPVTWSELPDVRADRFDIRNIWRRIEALPDPWGGFFEVRQSLDERARRVVFGQDQGDERR